MLETKMLETLTIPDTRLELMLQVQPEESLEWNSEVKGQYTDWQNLESSSHLVAVIHGISHDGDWLVVQTKGLDSQPAGRYAQAMNTGRGYQLEVAHVSDGTTYNWRVGLGLLADEAGNEPYKEVTLSQNLSLAAVSEVMVSWLHGQGLPLGYGAALHVYR
ncbi:hypothetical protein [Arthrobacter sp. ISL-28]|uniref:hypothetical protein n=1 Tax=Arthrobacter sp. ISL-28 TaxID=2819108 RepID=UPI001BECD898|nr:hypothetical protein [Arthrobacter sp. ISL-28]MBT2519740.1 hypothetical protein [Arthrobacter sp. ISL-28]